MQGMLLEVHPSRCGKAQGWMAPMVCAATAMLMVLPSVDCAMDHQCGFPVVSMGELLDKKTATSKNAILHYRSFALESKILLGLAAIYFSHQAACSPDGRVAVASAGGRNVWRKKSAFVGKLDAFSEHRK